MGRIFDSLSKANQARVNSDGTLKPINGYSEPQRGYVESSNGVPNIGRGYTSSNGLDKSFLSNGSNNETAIEYAKRLVKNAVEHPVDAFMGLANSFQAGFASVGTLINDLSFAVAANVPGGFKDEILSKIKSTDLEKLRQEKLKEVDDIFSNPNLDQETKNRFYSNSVGAILSDSGVSEEEKLDLLKNEYVKNALTVQKYLLDANPTSGANQVREISKAITDKIGKNFDIENQELANMTGNFLSMAVGGGLGRSVLQKGGSRLLANLVSQAVPFSSMYDEAIQDEKNRSGGGVVGDLGVMSTALGTALVNSFIETRLGLNPAAGFGKSATRKMLVDSVKDLAKGSIDDAFKLGTKSFGQIGKDIVTNSVGEGVEEVLQQLTTDTGKYIADTIFTSIGGASESNRISNPFLEKSSDEIKSELVHSFVGGALLGGLISGVKGIAEKSLSKEYDNAAHEYIRSGVEGFSVGDSFSEKALDKIDSIFGINKNMGGNTKTAISDRADYLISLSNYEYDKQRDDINSSNLSEEEKASKLENISKENELVNSKISNLATLAVNIPSRINAGAASQALDLITKRDEIKKLRESDFQSVGDGEISSGVTLLNESDRISRAKLEDLYIKTIKDIGDKGDVIDISEQEVELRHKLGLDTDGLSISNNESIEGSILENGEVLGSYNSFIDNGTVYYESPDGFWNVLSKISNPKVTEDGNGNKTTTPSKYAIKEKVALQGIVQDKYLKSASYKAVLNKQSALDNQRTLEAKKKEIEDKKQRNEDRLKRIDAERELRIKLKEDRLRRAEELRLEKEKAKQALEEKKKEALLLKEQKKQQADNEDLQRRILDIEDEILSIEQKQKKSEDSELKRVGREEVDLENSLKRTIDEIAKIEAGDLTGIDEVDKLLKEADDLIAESDSIVVKDLKTQISELKNRLKELQKEPKEVSIEDIRADDGFISFFMKYLNQFLYPLYEQEVSDSTFSERLEPIQNGDKEGDNGIGSISIGNRVYDIPYTVIGENRVYKYFLRPSIYSANRDVVHFKSNINGNDFIFYYVENSDTPVKVMRRNAGVRVSVTPYINDNLKSTAPDLEKRSNSLRAILSWLNGTNLPIVGLTNDIVRHLYNVYSNGTVYIKHGDYIYADKPNSISRLLFDKSILDLFEAGFNSDYVDFINGVKAVLPNISNNKLKTIFDKINATDSSIKELDRVAFGQIIRDIFFEELDESDLADIFDGGDETMLENNNQTIIKSYVSTRNKNKGQEAKRGGNQGRGGDVKGDKGVVGQQGEGEKGNGQDKNTGVEIIKGNTTTKLEDTGGVEGKTNSESGGKTDGAKEGSKAVLDKSQSTVSIDNVNQSKEIISNVEDWSKEQQRIENDKTLSTEEKEKAKIESTAKALELEKGEELNKILPERDRLQHRIIKDENTTTADDMTKGGNLIPNDFYQHPEYYADLSESTYKESWAAIKKIKGNPDAEITIYRSAPKGSSIEEGDWVSLSKKYAKQEGEHPTDESQDLPVISMKVKAKEIVWDGNDINEFAFYPEKSKSKAERISEAYHKAKAGGSNPELVKAVEDLLSKQTEQPTEVSTKPTETQQELKISNIPKVGDYGIQDSSNIYGDEDTLYLSNGEEVSYRYAIAEADELFPSNNPITFEVSDKFPIFSGQNANSRSIDYRDSAITRAKVEKDASNLNPKQVINNSSIPADGSPVVTTDNVSISGNGRLMMILRAISLHPEKYKQYRDYLIKNSDKFGISSEQVSKFRLPVLVRVVDSVKEYSTLEFDKYNQDSQKKETPTNDLIKKSNIIRQISGLRDRLFAIIGGVENRSEIFNSRDLIKSIITILSNNGVITENELPLLLNDSGLLTDDGKNLITDILISSVLNDESIRISENIKDFRRKLLYALPELISNYKLGDNSLETELASAIRLQNEVAKSSLGQKGFWDYVSSYNLFDNPISASIVALNRIINSGQLNFKNLLSNYNNYFAVDENNLFGESIITSKNNVLGELLKSVLNEEEYKVYESYRDSTTGVAEGGQNTNDKTNERSSRGDVKTEGGRKFNTAAERKLKKNKEKVLRLLSKLQEKYKGVNIHFFDDNSSIKSAGIELKNGEVVYGFKNGNDIWINIDRLNFETSIHEFSHIWEDINKAKFKEGVSLVKQTEEGRKLYSELSQISTYKDLSPNDIWSEVLNTMIGKYGEGYFSGGLLKKFRMYVNELFIKYSNYFGIKLSPKMKLEDFLNNVFKDIISDEQVEYSNRVGDSKQFQIRFRNGYDGYKNGDRGVLGLSNLPLTDGNKLNTFIEFLDRDKLLSHLNIGNNFDEFIDGFFGNATDYTIDKEILKDSRLKNLLKAQTLFNLLSQEELSNELSLLVKDVEIYKERINSISSAINNGKFVKDYMNRFTSNVFYDDSTDDFYTKDWQKEKETFKKRSLFENIALGGLFNSINLNSILVGLQSAGGQIGFIANMVFGKSDQMASQYRTKANFAISELKRKYEFMFSEVTGDRISLIDKLDGKRYEVSFSEALSVLLQNRRIERDMPDGKSGEPRNYLESVGRVKFVKHTINIDENELYSNVVSFLNNKGVSLSDVERDLGSYFELGNDEIKNPLFLLKGIMSNLGFPVVTYKIKESTISNPIMEARQPLSLKNIERSLFLKDDYMLEAIPISELVVNDYSDKSSFIESSVYKHHLKEWYNRVGKEMNFDVTLNVTSIKSWSDFAKAKVGNTAINRLEEYLNKSSNTIKYMPIITSLNDITKRIGRSALSNIFSGLIQVGGSFMLTTAPFRKSGSIVRFSKEFGKSISKTLLSNFIAYFKNPTNSEKIRKQLSLNIEEFFDENKMIFGDWHDTVMEIKKNSPFLYERLQSSYSELNRTLREAIELRKEAKKNYNLSKVKQKIEDILDGFLIPLRIGDISVILTEWKISKDEYFDSGIELNNVDGTKVKLNGYEAVSAVSYYNTKTTQVTQSESSQSLYKLFSNASGVDYIKSIVFKFVSEMLQRANMSYMYISDKSVPIGMSKSEWNVKRTLGLGMSAMLGTAWYKIVSSMQSSLFRNCGFENIQDDISESLNVDNVYSTTDFVLSSYGAAPEVLATSYYLDKLNKKAESTKTDKDSALSLFKFQDFVGYVMSGGIASKLDRAVLESNKKEGDSLEEFTNILLSYAIGVPSVITKLYNCLTNS